MSLASSYAFSRVLQTLDALPSHILTPFIGPVPPSNLLDKLAKGVVEAKSTSEWPHSIRKTRFKLVELARQRAKEAVQEDARNETIAEEDGDHRDVFQPTTNTGSRRPLYRQSSMDFMEYAKLDIGNTDPYSRYALCLLCPAYLVFEPLCFLVLSNVCKGPNTSNQLPSTTPILALADAVLIQTRRR